MAILPIARNTWRESLREGWMLISIATMGGLCTLIHLAELGGPGQGRAALDAGASLMLLCGNLLAIYLAANAIPIELEKRTAYVVLTKPVGRLAFLAGKYLGLMACLGVTWFAMTLVWLAFACLDGVFKPSLCLLSAVAGGEVAVVAAMALMFGALTHRLLAMSYSLTLLFLCQFGTMIREYALTEYGLNSFTYWAGLVVSWAMPHLEVFDLKGWILYGPSIPWWPAWWALVYAAALVSCFLLLAAAGWSSRELP